MIGIEKVTGKIISEAELYAEKTLSAAKETCEKIRLETNGEIDAIREKADAEIEAEGKDIISRAESSSVMKCRGIMLSAKSDALDKTFSLAEEKILSLPDDEYLILCLNFAKDALSGLPADAQCCISACERDIVRYGAVICKAFSAKYPGVVFSLSETPARISGGFLLDFGLTDADCSVGTVISQARPSLEGEVCRILFDRSVKR